MSTAQTKFPKPRQFENSIHRWTINFLSGFAVLFFTIFVATCVRRVLGSQWVNTNGADFQSRIELYHAVDQHFTIGLITLAVWATGLFISGYLAGRNYANSKVMISCLSAACLMGWVIPHVWLNGGFIGVTSFIRALLVVPMLTWGVLLAREHSLSRFTLDTKKTGMAKVAG